MKVVRWISAVVDRNCSTPILFWYFSNVGLPGHVDVPWMGIVLQYPSPGRSRQRLNTVSRPRTTIWRNEGAFDDGISTVAANGRLVLHVHEIDASTLSPECQEPSNSPTSTEIGSWRTVPRVDGRKLFSLCTKGFRRSDILLTL